jgi:hypothetical protein
MHRQDDDEDDGGRRDKGRDGRKEGPSHRHIVPDREAGKVPGASAVCIPASQPYGFQLEDASCFLGGTLESSPQSPPSPMRPGRAIAITATRLKPAWANMEHPSLPVL